MNRSRRWALFFIVTLAFGFAGWAAKVQGVIEWPWPLALLGFLPSLLLALWVLLLAAACFLVSNNHVDPYQ